MFVFFFGAVYTVFVHSIHVYSIHVYSIHVYSTIYTVVYTVHMYTVHMYTVHMYTVIQTYILHIYCNIPEVSQTHAYLCILYMYVRMHAHTYNSLTRTHTPQHTYIRTGVEQWLQTLP